MKLDQIFKSASVSMNQTSSSEAFESDAVFSQIRDALKSNPDAVQNVKGMALSHIRLNCQGVFLFNLTKDEAKKSWTIDLASAPPRVFEGKPEKADVTITVADDDYFALATGILRRCWNAFFAHI